MFTIDETNLFTRKSLYNKKIKVNCKRNRTRKMTTKWLFDFVIQLGNPAGSNMQFLRKIFYQTTTN